MAVPDIGKVQNADSGQAVPAKASVRGSVQSKQRNTSTWLVRSVRDRSQSFSGLSESFDHELLRNFSRNLKIAAPLLASLSLCVAGFFLYDSKFQNPFLNGAILTWAGLFVVSMLIMSRMGQEYLAQTSENTKTSDWNNGFTLASIATSTLWAFAILYAVRTEDIADDKTIIAMSLVYTTIIAMLFNPIPHATRMSILIIWVAEIAGSIVRPELATEILTLLTCGVQIVFLWLSKAVFNIHLTAIKSEVEKDRLIVELEMEKSNAESERKRAEEANASKTKFLATMSHELRTPMNAILGFSEVMMNDVLGPHQVPQYKEYCVDIHTSGQHLLKLINELLELSKIDAGHHQLIEESCALTEIANSCVRILRLRMQERDLQLEETYEKRLPNIWADNRAIRQVLLNLLSNAIKFTPKGGAIFLKVGWTASGGQYLVVQDTGQGIPKDEIATVLSAFGQGSQKTGTSEGGTGLGLPITKALIEMHGGKFTLESEPGKGTTVLATFPANRVIDPAVARRSYKRQKSVA